MLIGFRTSLTWLAPLLVALVALTAALPAAADPVSTTPRFVFAGNVDFTVTAGSLRTQSNAGNACAIGGSDSAALAGIPAGSSIAAAYLYWAGSGPTIDNTVTFNGSTVTADRTFTDNYSLGAIDLDFFSGFADVTALVSGNGSYTFSGLTVTNTNLPGGGTYCTNAAVLAGWGLVVVYENAAEPLRLINLFDGFQPFRGSQIQLAPSNFQIPPAPIDGKIGILSWEGDVENSAPFNGVTENLIFDGQSTAAVALTDGANPLNNQYNSTINVNGTNNDFGVDFDVYDISSRLRAGDTSADTTYASGGDLVLLSVQIISTTNEPAADLVLDKSHSGDFSNGATNAWDLSVDNRGPSAATLISIADTLPAGQTYAGFSSADPSWACSAVGQSVTCDHPGPVAAGAALTPVSIAFTVPIGTTGNINNSATVSSATFDPRLFNNTDSDNGTVLTPNLSTSSKSVVDLNGLPTAPGDVVRYRITLSETGGAAVSGASISDSIDALLSNPIVTDAAGGTDNSTATVVQVDDLSVAANGSTTVEFEATIVGSAADGSIVPNTAVISNPGDGSSINAIAPNLTIGNAPASGIKPLYLGDIAGSTNNPTLPLGMSRTPLTANSSPVRVRIRRQDNDRLWVMQPALQADLTISDDALPVTLFMRRNNTASTRNIRVTASWRQGATTNFIGCSELSIAGSGTTGLANNVTRGFVFPLTQSDASCTPIAGAPLTIPAGAEITLLIDNEPNPASGQAIFVYPFNSSTGESSRIELPATTVINVDNIDPRDAAFPAGASVTSVAPGDPVFVRSIVSDPFGSFDISAVSVRVLDANGTVAASGPMTQVQDSGAATATYEFGLTVPGVGPEGVWSIEITADEGTEGTVSHTATTSFVVTDTNVVLEKLSRVVSDGVTNTTNPKSIPGSIIEYTIRVTNASVGPLDAESVVVRDSLPAEMRLQLGTPADPMQLVQGPTPSGLSLDFVSLADPGDDIAFSNDGGASFVTPAVDGAGFDATTPRINFIEVRPSGTFAGSGGGAAPSFELRFQMRVE